MTQTEIEAQIVTMGLGRTPTARILRRADNPLWNYGGLQLAREVCRNVHWFGHFGHLRWKWNGNYGVNSGGKLGMDAGEPLARGLTAETNCGGFNATARWIGTRVLGLSDTFFVNSSTLARFITKPDTVGIDRKWPGNVRTLTTNFKHLKAYFFTSHSFSAYNGTMLDASTDTMDFRDATDLYWFDLSANTTTDVTDGVAFKVLNRYHNAAVPGNRPYALISVRLLRKWKHHFPLVGGDRVTWHFISTMPEMTGDWGAYLLVSYDHLPAAFRLAVGLV